METRIPLNNRENIINNGNNCYFQEYGFCHEKTAKTFMNGYCFQCVTSCGLSKPR